VAQGIYLALAAAFILVSTCEVERQVFGMPLRSNATAANCSYQLALFDDAITRGLSRAALEHTRGKADEAFEDIISTPLAAVEKHCTSGADLGAFAAATRLREAAEASMDEQQSVLDPLRTAVRARRNP
jgi:hypothetical protein